MSPRTEGPSAGGPHPSPLQEGAARPAVLRPASPQDAGRLRAPGGGGRHDDHGEEARPQVRLHLCAVPLQPPASPRVAHAAERVLEPALACSCPTPHCPLPAGTLVCGGAAAPLQRLAGGPGEAAGLVLGKGGGSVTWVTPCFGLAGAPWSASVQLKAWAGQDSARRVLPRMPPSLQPAWFSSSLPPRHALAY